MEERWLQPIDETTRLFREAFDSLNEEQLNWKPSPKEWSIAQNIDHLIVINNTYLPVLESVRNNTFTLSWIGKIGFMVNFMGRLILQSVQPDRRKRMKTFPSWEPSSSKIDGDILDRFEEHQNALKELIRSSKDLVDANTVISSPANKNIVYKLETAFDIIVTHEKRHLEQAKEVLQRMDGKR